MSGTVSVPNTFGAATSGTTPQLDANFTALVAALNNPLTYAINSTDSGAVNAYVATLAPAPSSQASLLGVQIIFKNTAANTGASTLNVNGLGVQAIVDRRGVALSAGMLPANAVSIFMWDGSNYILQNPSVASSSNSLGADVLLNNTGNYFDGPSINVGTVGTFLLVGTVTVIDTSGTAAIDAKLWDGTTVVASARGVVPAANQATSISLSAIITNPAANVRISVKDPASVNGKILFNATGNSKDSTLTAIRLP